MLWEMECEQWWEKGGKGGINWFWKVFVENEPFFQFIVEKLGLNKSLIIRGKATGFRLSCSPLMVPSLTSCYVQMFVYI